MGRIRVKEKKLNNIHKGIMEIPKSFMIDRIICKNNLMEERQVMSCQFTEKDNQGFYHAFGYTGDIQIKIKSQKKDICRIMFIQATNAIGFKYKVK